MPSDLTNAQITAKQQLQRVIAAAVTSAWGGLPHYNQEQVDQFLTAVIPLAAAANRQAVMLTDAFLARALGRQPLGVDAAEIVAGIRNGTTPDEVYQRPFVTVWSALGRGVPWDKAVTMGLDRATSAAVTDVQLSFTHTLRAVGEADTRITGYQRVPDAGACLFCEAASGQIYHSEDLAPLHNGCGCGVDPVTEAIPSRAPDEFAGADGLQVAVRDHGELGPVLTNASDHFTTEGEALGHH